jgi:hypothetical protein
MPAKAREIDMTLVPSLLSALDALCSRQLAVNRISDELYEVRVDGCCHYGRSVPAALVAWYATTLRRDDPVGPPGWVYPGRDCAGDP